MKTKFKMSFHFVVSVIGFIFCISSSNAGTGLSLPFDAKVDSVVSQFSQNPAELYSSGISFGDDFIAIVPFFDHSTGNQLRFQYCVGRFGAKPNGVYQVACETMAQSLSGETLQRLNINSQGKPPEQIFNEVVRRLKALKSELLAEKNRLRILSLVIFTAAVIFAVVFAAVVPPFPISIGVFLALFGVAATALDDKFASTPEWKNKLLIQVDQVIAEIDQRTAYGTAVYSPGWLNTSKMEPNSVLRQKKVQRLQETLGATIDEIERRTFELPIMLP